MQTKQKEDAGVAVHYFWVRGMFTFLSSGGGRNLFLNGWRTKRLIQLVRRNNLTLSPDCMELWMQMFSDFLPEQGFLLDAGDQYLAELSKGQLFKFGRYFVADFFCLLFEYSGFDFDEDTSKMNPRTVLIQRHQSMASLFNAKLLR